MIGLNIDYSTSIDYILEDPKERQDKRLREEQHDFAIRQMTEQDRNYTAQKTTIEQEQHRYAMNNRG